MASEAQRNAVKRYEEKNVTRRNVKFYPKDAELLEWYEQQPRKNEYLLGLIRADMESRR